MRHHSELNIPWDEPVLPPAIRPGLHCGGEFPLFEAAQCECLPPAIRPGPHCGDETIEPGAFNKTLLPPAIRPGLHCGSRAMALASPADPASPGHQAGAPLRPTMARQAP